MPGSSAPQSSSQASEDNIKQSAYPAQQTDPQSESTHASKAEPQYTLSDRELQIVELIASGLTNQEISEKLAISKRTVDNHVSNVLSKTATGNRVALVRWALQSGKVCIDELNCCTLPDPATAKPKES